VDYCIPISLYHKSSGLQEVSALPPRCHPAEYQNEPGVEHANDIENEEQIEVEEEYMGKCHCPRLIRGCTNIVCNHD
jgi:hypothetical protein